MKVIVPNHIRDAIVTVVDEFLEKHPELKGAYDDMYNDLLDCYDKTGEIAELKRFNVKGD